MNDVTTQHSENQALDHHNGATKTVKCNWRIDYQTKSSFYSNLFSLPLLFLFGHTKFFYERIQFTTFHDLTPKEVRRLKISSSVRSGLLPLTAIGVVFGALVFISFFIYCIFQYQV